MENTGETNDGHEKLLEVNWRKTVLFWGGATTLLSCGAAFFIGLYLFDSFTAKCMAVITFAAVGILGRETIEVGHKANLLLLGERTNIVLTEGIHWLLPLLLSYSERDVRQQTKTLDSLEVFTKDQVRVGIKGTIVWRVDNLYRFLSISQQVIDDGLDEIFDEVIRVITADAEVDTVLKSTFVPDMRTRLADEAQSQAKKWGIYVIRVIISEVEVDKAVMEDLAQARREQAQRKAQKIEGETTRDLMDTIDPNKELGAQARLEGAQLMTGRVTKTVNRDETGQDAGSLKTYERIADSVEQGLVGVAKVIAEAITSSKKKSKKKKSKSGDAPQKSTPTVAEGETETATNSEEGGTKDGTE